MANVIRVLGFPPNILEVKLRRFIEKYSGPNSVNSVEKGDDGETVISFRKAEHCMQFMDSGLDSMGFGGKKIVLTILTREDIGEQNSTAHSTTEEKIKSAVVGMDIQQTQLASKQKEQWHNKSDLKTTYYWHTMQQLPAPEGTKCIIVTNINPTIHYQNIIMHFESKKRSNGGPVKCILKLIDGILVVFKNSLDSDQVLSKVGQTFDGKLLKIYPKVIPMFYEKKFFISGVAETTLKHTLELFLEKCSKDETTPEVCEKQGMTGIYLLEYGNDFDSSEINSLMSKINEEPLEDHKLWISRLLRSDCLKIGNIPANSSNDEIRLLFESKKRTGGGQVTKISRTESHRLIYFALFEDAERIYDKYKPFTSQKLYIRGNELMIEMYFPCLVNDQQTKPEQEEIQASPEEEMKSAIVEPFHYSLEKIDKSILRLVRNGNYHLQRLQDAFKGIASVSLLLNKKSEIACTPISGKNSNFKSRRVFEKECQKQSENFFSDYEIIHEAFKKKKISALRVQKVFPLLEKDFREENGKVTQYWEEENIFVCVGLKKDVPSVIDDVRECINSTVVDMQNDNEQYSKLVNCCILEEIKAMFRDVRVIEDEDMKKITLIGPQNKVSALQIQALTMLNSIKKKKLAELDLDESLKVFFRDHFKKVSAQKKLEEMFRAEQLKTCFIFEENEFEFFMRVISNIHEVTKFINDIITTHVMQLEGTDGSLLRSSEWKTFQQKLETEGKVRIFIQPNNSLLLIGLANEVEDAIQRTRKVLDENMTIDKVVSADFGPALYALEKSINFTPGWQKSLSITECRLTSQSGGGIYMKVKKCTLEKAVSALKAILQNIVSTPHELYDAGLNEYFKEEQGKQFLKNTESFLKCIILTSADPQTWPADDHMIASAANPSIKHQSMPSKRSETLASVTLSGSGVVLQVWKDDIIKHKSDIIVNASNSELELLPQGVSGVIKSIDEKNGNKVQQEMRKIIQRNRGSLPPGEAELTTSGGLTNCKKIIHAIGPRWNESYHKYDPKLILKACISQVLNEAEKTRLRTIAIPAISCGVFGGKVQDCIPLIVEATVEYFTETTNSCIQEVHFIENQKEIVLKEFQKEINLLQPSTSNTTIYHPPTTIVPPSALSRNVSLVQGDIANQTADAIVNITQLQPNFMQGTAISKALAAKAGQNIENQVTLPSSNGSVVKTSAGKLSCKKLYHGFVTTFNNRDSEFIVRSIVSKCLENAETDQYRSIAFPAIATGNFHHPPNLVAKWMKDEISKFTGTYLQAIIIVIFPRDQQSISAFNAEFSPLQKMIPSSISVQTVDSSSVSIGPLTVSVYQGDITQQKSDAIVNSTNGKFDLSQGMISKSITRKGGPQIQAEASSASGTDLRVTKGGNLACKYIYHIVASTEDEIKTVLIDLMEQAEKKQQIGSISIPALGTGNVGLSCSSVANAMRRALEKFAVNHQTTKALRKINIVVFDKTLLQDFRNGVLKTSDVPKGIMAKLKGTVRAIRDFWGSSDESTKEDGSIGPLEVLVVSTSKNTNDRALQLIQDEIKKVISTKLIEYETVGDLTEWEKWEIDQVKEKDHVDLRDMSNRYMKRIQIQGLTGNVLSANGAINEILRKFREAETCSHFVTWQRLTSQSTFVDYPSRASYVLEKAYKAFKAKTGSSKVTVPIYHQGTMSEYKVDLADMSAQNPTIKRISKESETTDIPKQWDDMGNEQCKKVTLLVGSSEYNEVLKSFGQTMANQYSSITQIERIQSLSQYKQYTAKKAEVTEKLNKCGSQNVVERRLFHGTSEDDKIIDNGFDRSYAGVHATAFGRGVYFAVTSQYSNGYAQPDTNGNRRMFLADVITGDYSLGSSTLVAPPVKTGGMKNDLYDSVVNNVANPTIFVIFKDASAYPTYLITYK